MEPITYAIAGAIGYRVMDTLYHWYTSDTGEQPKMPDPLLKDIEEGNIHLRHVDTPVSEYRQDTTFADEIASVIEARRKALDGGTP